MTRYEQIRNFDIEDMAWFIQTILETTEQQMLRKLSEYGLEVNIVTLDPEIRHKSILCDLTKEASDGSDT